MPGCAVDQTPTGTGPENVATESQALAASQTIIGYWHDFSNGVSTACFPLAQVAPAWDVVAVGFANDGGNGTVTFALDTTCTFSDAQFRADIKTLQSQGRKVILSLGGANGTMSLTNSTSQANFVNSLNAIIQAYNFDGIDLDLESGAGVSQGSTQQQLIVPAIQSIAATYATNNPGKTMYLSMAPEWPYVQGAVEAYTGIWGAYIPIIEGLP